MPHTFQVAKPGLNPRLAVAKPLLIPSHQTPDSQETKCTGAHARPILLVDLCSHMCVFQCPCHPPPGVPDREHSPGRDMAIREIAEAVDSSQGWSLGKVKDRKPAGGCPVRALLSGLLTAAFFWHCHVAESRKEASFFLPLLRRALIQGQHCDMLG